MTSSCFSRQTLVGREPGGNGSSGSSRLVNSHYFYKLGYLFEVPQGIARGLVVTAKEVYIKYILPGTSAHGSRLNFAEADVTQREHTQRFEQRSRHILDVERNGSLVRAAGNHS